MITIYFVCFLIYIFGDDVLLLSFEINYIFVMFYRTFRWCAMFDCIIGWDGDHQWLLGKHVASVVGSNRPMPASVSRTHLCGVVCCSFTKRKLSKWIR